MDTPNLKGDTTEDDTLRALGGEPTMYEMLERILAALTALEELIRFPKQWTTTVTDNTHFPSYPNGNTVGGSWVQQASSNVKGY